MFRRPPPPRSPPRSAPRRRVPQPPPEPARAPGSSGRAARRPADRPCAFGAASPNPARACRAAASGRAGSACNPPPSSESPASARALAAGRACRARASACPGRYPRLPAPRRRRPSRSAQLQPPRNPLRRAARRRYSHRAGRSAAASEPTPDRPGRIALPPAPSRRHFPWRCVNGCCMVAREIRARRRPARGSSAYEILRRHGGNR